MAKRDDVATIDVVSGSCRRTSASAASLIWKVFYDHCEKPLNVSRRDDFAAWLTPIPYSPFPTRLVAVLVFPIHSLVAQSGLVKDRRRGWGRSGLFRSAVVQGLADSRSRSQ